MSLVQNFAQNLQLMNDGLFQILCKFCNFVFEKCRPAVDKNCRPCWMKAMLTTAVLPGPLQSCNSIVITLIFVFTLSHLKIQVCCTSPKEGWVLAHVVDKAIDSATLFWSTCNTKYRWHQFLSTYLQSHDVINKTF